MVCASNNVLSNSVQGLESLLHCDCLQSFHKELQINGKLLLLKIGHVHVIILLSACNCGTCTADKSCRLADAITCCPICNFTNLRLINGIIAPLKYVKEILWLIFLQVYFVSE